MKNIQQDSKKDHEPKDWFYSNLPAPRVRTYNNLSHEDKCVFNVLHPFSQEYYSILTPLFLAESDIADPSSANFIFNNYDTLFVRDGLMTVWDFFIKNPKPHNKTKTILLDEQFSFAVPKAWYKKVYLCSTMNTKKPRRKKDKILVYINLITALDDIQFIKKELLAIKDEIPGHDLKLEFYINLKEDGFFWSPQSNIYSEFYHELFEIFGTDISFSCWTDLEKKGSFDNYYIYEINEGLFYSDSFVRFHLLSRGGHLFDTPTHEDLNEKQNENSKDEQWFDLSLTHGVLARSSFKLHEWTPEDQKRITKLQSFADQSTKHNAPWKKGSIEFSRKLKEIAANY